MVGVGELKVDEIKGKKEIKSASCSMLRGDTRGKSKPAGTDARVEWVPKQCNSLSGSFTHLYEE